MTCAVSAFIVVDLPAPFGPSSPTHLPNGTSRSSPSTAVIGPNLLTKPRSLMAEGEANTETVDRPGRVNSSLDSSQAIDSDWCAMPVQSNLQATLSDGTLTLLHRSTFSKTRLVVTGIAGEFA